MQIQKRRFGKIIVIRKMGQLVSIKNHYLNPCQLESERQHRGLSLHSMLALLWERVYVVRSLVLSREKLYNKLIIISIE